MQGGANIRKEAPGDEAVVAVVEFLSAFTLFLMILTAFMSLSSIRTGSNDPYTDLIDRSAIDGLDRLTSSNGYYVPYVDGVRDQNNATTEWHQVPVMDLYNGLLQPGIVDKGVLDFERINALPNVTIEAMSNGLGLAKGLQLRLLIVIESSSNSSKIGEVLFEGGSDRSTSGTSSVANRKFINGEDIISVSLEVHDGASTPKLLRVTEFSPRPVNGGGVDRDSESKRICSVNERLVI